MTVITQTAPREAPLLQSARRSRGSPGRPTRAHAIARDAELLDKALDLFLEAGFERTSIEAITAAVGMAKRTIYARYGDKRRLFEAALKRAVDEWRVPTEQLRAAETGDLQASLLAIAQILIANILTPAGIRLMHITNAEARHMPEIGVFTNLLGTRTTRDFLGELFTRRISGGMLSPDEADTAALSFLHLVVGGPANLALGGFRIETAVIESLTAYNVHLFLHGLLPREGASGERPLPPSPGRSGF
jgi:AcrR family transcriptional regulator